MVECLRPVFLDVFALIDLGRLRRDVEVIVQVLELPDVVVAVVGHRGQQNFVVEAVVLLHERL